MGTWTLPNELPAMSRAVVRLPSAPVVMNEKSETVMTSDGYKNSVLDWRTSAREEAMSTLRRNPEWDRLRTYLDMLEGKQWDRRLPRYRTRFVDNRLAETRINRLSQLTDIRPAVEVSCEQQEYRTQAEIAQKIIYHEWARQDLDLALESAVDHALLSIGYWKLGAWYPGTMSVLACGMDSVLPIQPGRDIQSSAAVLYRTYHPMAYYKRVYGKRADGIENESTAPMWTDVNYDTTRPGYLNEYTFNSMSPAMRYMQGSRLPARAMHGGAGVFPVAEIEEYWIEDYSVNEFSQPVIMKDPRLPLDAHNYHYKVKPGERLFPRKRMIALVGNTILYDGPSPYWHGLYPFAQLILNPHVWGPGGLSIYRNLVPIQRGINEIGSGVLDLCRRAVEPQIIAREGAVADAAWNAFSGDMPGGKLRTLGMAGANEVRYMEPPPLPAYAQVFQQQLSQTFDRLSGSMDMGQILGKKQLPGGDSIEQFRDSLQAAFRLESRHIEPFLRQIGLQAVSNIFQYYTREKRMWMFGADGTTKEDFDYDPGTMVPWTMPREDHWKLFSVIIGPGSLHGASADRAKMVAMSLFRLGALSRKALLRKLNWAPPDEIARIEQEIAEERSTGLEPDATGKGRVPQLTRGQRTGNPF